MLVWLLHNNKPLNVQARPYDETYWYVPSIRKLVDSSKMFRRPQGLIRHILSLQHERKCSKAIKSVSYLRLIPGGKVA